MTSSSREMPIRSLSGALLWIAACATLYVSLRHLVYALPHHGGLEHVSGAWIALARDFADGTFYRPLFAESGYGGTRFFPLHFVLHGWLMRAGLPTVLSGHLLGIGSIIALVLGAYRLMRALGAARGIAAPFAILALSPMASQHALVTIRGDGLAVALNVWGLVACVSSARSALPAALLFTLAFATKVTAVYAPAAAVLALMIAGRRDTALRLALLTAAGIAAVLVVMHIASDGRALETLAACASGGTHRRFLLNAPIRFVERALAADPQTLVILAAGLGTLLMARPRAWLGLAPLTALLSIGTVIVIMGSPGTDYNHFIDANVLALVLIAALFTGHRRFRVLSAVLAGATLILLLGWTQAVVAARAEDPHLELAVGIVREEDTAEHPVLCESPLLPILAGHRPFMLDSFMYRLIAARHPEAGRQMESDLRRGRFSAVILYTDPASEAGRARLRFVHFGQPFVSALLASYEEVERHGSYVVLRPKR